jgi:anti-sigma28 factor (negative regulator of flagellin synthesis)
MARAETLRLSQQEYVTRLRQLNDDIAHAWVGADRINALKLAIKVGAYARSLFSST